MNECHLYCLHHTEQNLNFNWLARELHSKLSTSLFTISLFANIRLSVCKHFTQKAYDLLLCQPITFSKFCDEPIKLQKWMYKYLVWNKQLRLNVMIKEVIWKLPCLDFRVHSASYNFQTIMKINSPNKLECKQRG